MRVIKLGLISIVFFAIFITIFSLFFPSRVRISKAIDINADKAMVMAEVKDAVNWKKWYPGADSLPPFMVDGKIKGIMTGPQQAVMIAAVNDSVVLAVNTGPHAKRGETGWNFYATEIPNSVTVQWYMDFHLRWYPWEKFSGLLLEKRYGPMMEKGLEKLKSITEKGN